MIAYLKGKILDKLNKSVILLSNDIGYEIFLPEKFLLKIKKDQELALYIYHKQREDSQELYGFENLQEREFFMQLISVSGVGPKSALSVLSISNINDLKKAIVSANADMFKKVSGIGTKTAERIVVELKNKLAVLDTDSNQENRAELDEVFEALNALGFNDNDIRSVYGKIPNDLKSISDKIKAALKLLKK